MTRTPLYDRHAALGARMVDFHGWQMPVQYEGILAEHHHCRQAAALFDTCHMGQLHFRGPDAASDLARICTQDALRLRPGQCAYGLLLDEQAGILDDTILMRLGDEEFVLVVNATTTDSDREWIASHLKGRTKMLDRSRQWGKLDLQGPASFEVLGEEFPPGLAELRFFQAMPSTWGRVECIVSRTGYTGELGYELYLPVEAVGELWDGLLGRPPVRPAGLGARDTLRLEMGYPLYGQDVSREVNPIEADLERFASVSRPYVGAAAVQRLATTSPQRRLVAFRSETRRRFSRDDAVFADGQEVGVVSSGAFSPSLEVSIGMGYVATAFSNPGQRLVVGTARAEIEVAVASKPLYTDGSARTRTKLGSDRT